MTSVTDRTCRTEGSCTRWWPRAWPPRARTSSSCSWPPSRTPHSASPRAASPSAEWRPPQSPLGYNKTLELADLLGTLRNTIFSLWKHKDGTWKIYFIFKLSLLRIIEFRGRFVIQKLVLFPGLERWQILVTDRAVVPSGLHMLRLHVLKQAGFELSVPRAIQTKLICVCHVFHY